MSETPLHKEGSFGNSRAKRGRFGAHVSDSFAANVDTTDGEMEETGHSYNDCNHYAGISRSSLAA